MNQTPDPDLKSWVESANDLASDFPIQNLPFGIFRKKSSKESPRGGVAIGDQILDLAAVGLKTGPTLNALAAPQLQKNYDAVWDGFKNHFK